MYATTRFGNSCSESMLSSVLSDFSMLLFLFRFATERSWSPDELLVRLDVHRFGARDFDECFLASHRRIIFRSAAAIVSVGVESPALHVVGERERKGLPVDASGQDRVANGKRDLDATKKISRHPVAAGNVELRLAAVFETKYARVLEETIDDRRDADVLTHRCHTRHEAADAANEEIDFHAGVAGAIERVDDRRLHESVELRHDRRSLAALGVLSLAIDHRNRPTQVIHRRDDEAIPLHHIRFDQLLHSRDAESGEEVHQL